MYIHEMMMMMNAVLALIDKSNKDREGREEVPPQPLPSSI